MIEAMVTVLAAWLILFCVIVGLGQFVRRLFGLRSESLQAWFAAFWIGYAVVITALQLWHFVLPIDWRTCLVIGIIGLVGFGLGIKHSSLRPFSKVRIVLFVILLIPAALWVANRALDAQLDFDTGLYHIASIRCANDSPAVLGLRNLHYRL